MSGLSWKTIGVIAALLLAFAVVFLFLTSVSNNALGTLDDPSSDLAAYVLVLLMVYGDAVVAVFPGETTLNVASTMAATDELALAPVIVAGALGAFLGDNTLYWIARSIPAVRDRARQAQEDDRFKDALSLIGRHAQVLVALCRFLPFVRWAVVAGMGALPMPYRTFIFSSAVGAAAWSAYTCIVAYAIGTALSEFPLGSIVIACASSGIIVAIVYFMERDTIKAARQKRTSD
jgi:membrane protein DedA with SNARE-associated domain